ncbi:hypothetical protein [Pararhizobium sp. A13]|uniref:hypothetical protein n=1 Tax=Pararhizobium sp. A13 TaxID=3133975 RepID=UPI00311B2868
MNQQPLSEGDAVSKGDILALMFELFPWARSYQQTPVRDYAKAAFDVAPLSPDCTIRHHAMSLLRSWIGRAARLRGFAEPQVSRFETEIMAFPVMQTGPHLHLLIEPDAFYTHLFSLMGLNAHRRQSYISYACSTVKFVERGRKGPAWLNLDGQAINVFGLSRRKMIPYSILAKNDRYGFRLQNADLPGHAPEAIVRLMRILPSSDFPSAAEAIKNANRCLWDHYFKGCADFLQLDDDDVADLVIAHLCDEQSWLRLRLIEDRTLASEVLASIDQLAGTAWRGWLKNSTHFFWGCDDGKLFPLWLDGAFLRASTQAKLVIPFSATSLVDALRSRTIVPNLLLMFIVTSMLPGVRVLGGSRHVVYYPLMRYAVCNALRKNGADRSLLVTLSRDVRPGAWGHRVISAAAEPFSLIEEAGISALLDDYGGLNLEEACGPLSGFTQDPLWAGLAEAFASGKASPASAYWALS